MKRTIYNLAAAMMAGSLVMGSYGMPVMASEVLEEEVVVAEEAAEMEETAPEEDWSAVDATYPDGISEGDAVPMEAMPMEAEPASDADFDMSTLAGEDTEIVVSAEPSQAAYISNLCSVRLLVLDENMTLLLGPLCAPFCFLVLTFERKRGAGDCPAVGLPRPLLS